MEQRVRSLVKEAMLEKNKNKQITYKSILEGAQKIAKQTNVAVTDEMIIKSVKNEIKQLNDLKQYCTEGTERFAEVIEKINYCEILLPKMISKEEIQAYLLDNNVEKNIGVCMNTLKSVYGTALDGQMAQGVVKEYITT